MLASKSVTPTSADVSDRLQFVRRRRPDYVVVKQVGTTAQGRPIEAVEITDLSEPADNKQHVLVVAGQHGNEETARLVALRLIDYLVGAEGRPFLRRQKIVVMPNVSPDAAEADTYATPAGVKPNLDHGPGGPQSPEARAVRDVADALKPDVYVDMHARGHAGWSHDMVLFPAARVYTEDEHLLHQIAAKMAAEGEKSGIPHVVHPLTWPGWGGHDFDDPSSTMYMYRRFKSLVFLTENAEDHENPIESSYPVRMRVASGLNRLKPLLAMGSTRSPKHFYNGYPLSPVVGMFHAGIVPVGDSVAVRRSSRMKIWENQDAFRSVALAIPERSGVKRLNVHYDGPTLSCGIGFQVHVARRLLVESVHVDGVKLKPDEVNGFYAWHTKHTTFAVAAVPVLTAGEHEIIFRFH